MAKRKKKQKEVEEDIEEGGGGGIFSSILAVGVIAGGVILLLALVGLAGDLGNTIDDQLAALMGIGRIFLPIVLLGVGADMILGDRRFLSMRGIGSLVIFLLGFNGLLNLVFARGQSAEAFAHAGGQLGTFFSVFVASNLGGLAAGVLAIAVGIIGLISLVNAPLAVMIAPLLDVMRSTKKNMTAAKVVRRGGRDCGGRRGWGS